MTLHPQLTSVVSPSCVGSLKGEGGNACWLLPFNYSLLDGRGQAESHPIREQRGMKTN